MNDLKEPGKVCWYVKRPCLKKRCPNRYDKTKVVLYISPQRCKKWSFLLENSAVSFNITTWKYVCTKNVLNMNVLVKKGG